MSCTTREDNQLEFYNYWKQKLDERNLETVRNTETKTNLKKQKFWNQ